MKGKQGALGAWVTIFPAHVFKLLHDLNPNVFDRCPEGIMMKRLFAFKLALVPLAIFLLLSATWAQSSDPADQFLKEAQTLKDKASGKADFVLSGEKYREALSLYQQSQNRRGEARSLDGLGDLYYELGRYREALEFNEKALKIAREDKNSLLEGRALINVGRAYSALGRRDEAVSCYQQSVAISREPKDSKDEGTALNNLGLEYDELGQYDKANGCYEKSLAIAREVKDTCGEARTLHNIGLLLSRRYKTDRALEFYEKSSSPVASRPKAAKAKD